MVSPMEEFNSEEFDIELIPFEEEATPVEDVSYTEEIADTETAAPGKKLKPAHNPEGNRAAKLPAHLRSYGAPPPPKGGFLGFPVETKIMEEAELLEVVEFLDETDSLEDEHPTEKLEELEDAEFLTIEEPVELIPVSETSAAPVDEELSPEESEEDQFEEIDIGLPSLSAPSVPNSLVSEIEFNVPAEITPEDNIDGELEIASPFDTILSDFSGEKIADSGEPDSGDEAASTTHSLQNKTASLDSPAALAANQTHSLQNKVADLEELIGGFGASLMYTPFQFPFSDGNFELLEVQEEEPDLEPAETEKVIEVRDGVNFINEKFLEPQEETVQTLDPEIVSLIAEVVNKNLFD
jgi:hypothetical protein